jgi:large subunit ribosomal protein L10Ae
MSKISNAVVKDAISEILKYSNETKKRKFTETVELQIGLKNYDVAKDKRVGGSIRLPKPPKSKSSVCVLGDQRHCNEAKALGVDNLSEDDLGKIDRKNKKLIKKLANKYDTFLASPALIKKIPRLLGPGLSKAGKFPQLIPPNASLADKIEEAAATIKFQLKTKPGGPMCMCVAVANVSMTPEQVEANVNTAVNYMVSLLKKRWQNVKRLYLKSSMGPSHKVFGL